MTFFQISLKLALAQTEKVANALKENFPNLTFEIGESKFCPLLLLRNNSNKLKSQLPVTMTTKGDNILDKALFSVRLGLLY